MGFPPSASKLIFHHLNIVEPSSFRQLPLLNQFQHKFSEMVSCSRHSPLILWSLSRDVLLP